MDSFIQAEEEETERDANGKALTNEATAQTPGLGLPTGKQSGSGTFTNLRDYLSANQKRVGQISGTLASGVAGEAGKIRSDIEKTRGDTLGSGSAIGQEQSRLAGAETGIEQTIAGAGQAQPQGLGVSEFQQFSKGTTGFQPQTLDFGKQKLSVDEYQQRIGRLGQPGGQFDAINTYLNKGAAGYTRGQSKLDQTLLSRDLNVRTDLNAAAQAGKKTLAEDSYENIQKEYQDQLAAAEQRRNELAAYTGEKLGSAESEIEQAIINRERDAQLQYDTLKAFKDQSIFPTDTPQDVKIDPAVLQQLGLSDLSSRLYGIDPSKYTNISQADPTLQNVASPEEFARAKALATLAGQPTAFGMTAPGDYIPGTFDRAGFEDARTKNQLQYEIERADLERALSYKKEAQDPVSLMNSGMSEQWADIHNKAIQEKLQELSKYSGAINPNQQYFDEANALQQQVNSAAQRQSAQQESESAALAAFRRQAQEAEKKRTLAAAALANPIATGAASVAKKIKKRFK